MTTTPGNASSNLPGNPPVADLPTWQAAREELLVREKAHTKEGDGIGAAGRRLPRVELDGAVEVTGVDGPVPFLDLFQGRDELVVYQHMWYDGAPYQGQCEGCTTTAWHMQDAVYLNARGVSFAVLTAGPWDEVAAYVEFMGYTQPWYSVRGVEAPVGGEMGHIVCFLRDGDRVFLTYSTTGRANEPVNGSLGLLDMTPYGRPRAGAASAELVGQGDDDALGAADVAEQVFVLVLHHVADEFSAVGAQAGKDVLDVVDGEHDAPYAKCVHRCARLSGGSQRRVKLDQLKPAVAVRHPQHCDVVSDAVEPDAAVYPLSLDCHLALQLETEFDKERGSSLEVVANAADVVHPRKRHVPSVCAG